MQTRRSFLISSGLVATLAASPAWTLSFPSGVYDLLDTAMADLEARSRGRLGVAILESGSGMTYAWRGMERFRMASTFKALLAGAVLRRVDQGQESLAREVEVRPEDLVEYAPVVEPMVGQSLTVGALCEGTVTLSDNAAANLLLDSMGGPEGFTAILREIGDEVTRLDRREPDLNTGTPDDPRDTSTPLAYLATLQRMLLGNALSTAGREQLLAWLVANKTGDDRIRAGVPEGWTVGDKTGTSGQGDIHDIAVLVPPKGVPILVVAFLSETDQPIEEMNGIHAEIGALAAQVA
ncbi:class A beta-lactamase [Rubellimicrobium roseum]|uniref:Beta-lactamase n=1 Tax=Rubellimicrobium roseum TaxID=687525 RepID=A0A5C4NBJ2_9RHOB|nr:class A beta-lactamase [Rubellimicrobium roseum]TNC66606.1 class A beta-lactamase [Rubellimicrobium roseum]